MKSLERKMRKGGKEGMKSKGIKKAKKRVEQRATRNKKRKSASRKTGVQYILVWLIHICPSISADFISLSLSLSLFFTLYSQVHVHMHFRDHLRVSRCLRKRGPGEHRRPRLETPVLSQAYLVC